MDLQTYGRTLVEVLAERSLSALRGTSMDDLRRLLGSDGASPTSEPVARSGAALGAFAVGAALGAGLTALYTPTSGTQLRKKLTVSARDAQRQAMEIGNSVGTSVRAQLHEARASIAETVEQATAAAGLTTVAPPRRASSRRSSSAGKRTNGHAKRAPSASQSRAPQP
jgi:hypothetical protein